MPPKVRAQLTISKNPVEVDLDEIPGLRAQGLLIGYEGETTLPAGGDGASTPPAGDAKAAAKPGRAAAKPDGSGQAAGQ